MASESRQLARLARNRGLKVRGLAEYLISLSTADHDLEFEQDPAQLSWTGGASN